VVYIILQVPADDPNEVKQHLSHLQVNLETFCELREQHDRVNDQEGGPTRDLVETRLVKDEEPTIEFDDSPSTEAGEQSLIYVTWETEVHPSMFGTVKKTDEG